MCRAVNSNAEASAEFLMLLGGKSIPSHFQEALKELLTFLSHTWLTSLGSLCPAGKIVSFVFVQRRSTLQVFDRAF